MTKIKQVEPQLTALGFHPGVSEEIDASVPDAQEAIRSFLKADVSLVICIFAFSLLAVGLAYFALTNFHESALASCGAEMPIKLDLVLFIVFTPTFVLGSFIAHRRRARLPTSKRLTIVVGELLWLAQYGGPTLAHMRMIHRGPFLTAEDYLIAYERKQTRHMLKLSAAMYLAAIVALLFFFRSCF